MNKDKLIYFIFLFPFFLTCNHKSPKNNSSLTLDRQVAQTSRGPLIENFDLIAISDIHLRTTTGLHPHFAKAVEKILALSPDIVVVTGDTTSGNKRDQFSQARVESWWQEFKTAISPWKNHGIAVMPVAGNHDSYRPEDRLGYLHQWQDLNEWLRYPLEIQNPTRDASRINYQQAPFSYSLEWKGSLLVLRDGVGQSIRADAAQWLDETLSSCWHCRTKLVFQHIPLVSLRGNTSSNYQQTLAGILATNQVSAIVVGHDHTYWDEAVTIGNHSLRQISVGTTGAIYNHPPNLRARRSAQCQNVNSSTLRCLMPVGQYSFELNKRSDGKMIQKNRLTFSRLRIDNLNSSIITEIWSYDETQREFIQVH